MTVYQYISRNIDRVRTEVQLGLVPCSVLRHWEIYSRYDTYKKMHHSVSDAVLFAANDMHVSERAVFKIIKRMEQNT
jgi:hypothetical protein